VAVAGAKSDFQKDSKSLKLQKERKRKEEEGAREEQIYILEAVVRRTLGPVE